MPSLSPLLVCFFFPMHREQTLPKVTCFSSLCASSSSHLLLLRAFQLWFPSAVTALRSLKRSLIDPKENLRNWNRGDPCRSNWTGVICFNEIGTDDYLHVRELYVFLSFFFLCHLLASLVSRLAYMLELNRLAFERSWFTCPFFSPSRGSCLHDQLFL